MSRYYSSERYEGTGERTKLRRGRGLFCGLCEGIGKWMGLPPWIFRGIFIALIFMIGGCFNLFYLLAIFDSEVQRYFAQRFNLVFRKIFQLRNGYFA